MTSPGGAGPAEAQRRVGHANVFEALEVCDDVVGAANDE